MRKYKICPLSEQEKNREQRTPKCQGELCIRCKVRCATDNAVTTQTSRDSPSRPNNLNSDSIAPNDCISSLNLLLSATVAPDSPFANLFKHT